ncbi:hypothetical protein HMPREF1985_01120 [Mitsuokella sp. oral taxon 131 str. W9106]|nr:hypothetical protein HMPREF1985_01120 [Mitsuokella sp. oral taxon 131 str. W9106]
MLHKSVRLFLRASLCAARMPGTFDLGKGAHTRNSCGKRGDLLYYES